MSSSEEDEDWTACTLDGEDEKVPGFEDHQVISTHDLPGDNGDTIMELFLAKDPQGKVSLIQVDPDNEESTMLDGSDCNKVRQKLCSLKGIDPDEVDAETAHAIFVAEMGEVPSALAEFDKGKTKAPKHKKDISDSDDDCEKKPEAEEKKRKVESSTASAEKKKSAAAKPKKKSSAPATKAAVASKASKKISTDISKKAAPQRQAKKPEKPKKETAEAARKEPPKKEDVVAASAPAASEEKPKRPPAKRKRDGMLDAFVVKSEPPPKKASPPSASFTWQLTVNGNDMASLRTTLAAFPS